jgi:hypothetical protein
MATRHKFEVTLDLRGEHALPIDDCRRHRRPKRLRDLVKQRFGFGSTGLATKRAPGSPKKLRRSGRRWPCTESTASVPGLRDPGAPDPPRGKRFELLARCQTGGRIIADGGLSQLLKADRPRTLDAEATTRAGRESHS